VIIKEELLPIFIHLLKDQEAEVKTSAATQIPGFCSLIDKNTVLNEVMPAVADMVTDSSQHVRGSVASHISGLAPIVGKDK
jgi:serine/threonine-protein phosphatase 2A regulatory subunit A